MTQTVLGPITTVDSGETIGTTVPALPHGQISGTGFGWIAALEATAWDVLSLWGEDGYDAGGWPHTVLATTTWQTDNSGTIHGLATYTEGDTTTSWYRDKAAFYEAITEHCFFHWKHGQAHGPANLPEHVADLPAEYFRPYTG